MIIPTGLQDVLVCTVDTLCGAVRFAGTRIPVQALLDTLICGESVECFVDDYPDVTKEQALAVLRWEQNKVRPTLGLELAS
jgi:uncharacterized protein (DUF433 family)